MPARKRALSERNANVETTPKRTRKGKEAATVENNEPQNGKADEQAAEPTKKQRDQQKDGNDQKLSDATLDKAPHTYICTSAPHWDREDDECDDDEDGVNDETDSLYMKPASAYPNQKWITTWQTWKTFSEALYKIDHTNPDLFGMYIYTDFHWYGLYEILENMIVAFDKARTAYTKSPDDKSLLSMWSEIAAIGLWINFDDAANFQRADDGERTEELIGVVGCAFINALVIVDKAGQLKQASIIKDLGLVMSCFLRFSERIEVASFIESAELIIAFATKGEIDLVATGCRGTAEIIETLEYEGLWEGLSKSVEKDFNLTKALKDYKRLTGHLGGEDYNILKMSRAERADFAFDKKDPLADFTDAQIKSGKLGLVR